MTTVNVTEQHPDAASGTEAEPRQLLRGALRLTGVTKTFGDVVAVNDVDLEVQPGEFVSLLGPSGCGKTTTVRMLAGFEDPDAGEIWVSGQAMRGVPPNKRDVNTVFQSYALFPHLTVAQNVAYGLRQRGVGRSELRQRVADALDMVRMTPQANRKPRQLSGGQQQRVALARALVNRPSVLLLDEPMSALDRKLREEMQIELKLLQSQLRTTFVLVTHDQGEALSMSDRIAVMRDGRIEQLGDPDLIYDEPATAFVAGFIGQQNFFAGVVDDGVVLRSADVVLRSSRSLAADAGPALAAVRPEHVTLAAERPDGADNVAEGTVAGVSHLGDVIQYIVSAPGREVIARVPRATGVRYDVGAAVWCHWTPEAVRLFATDTEPTEEPA